MGLRASLTEGASTNKKKGYAIARTRGTIRISRAPDRKLGCNNSDNSSDDNDGKIQQFHHLSGTMMIIT